MVRTKITARIPPDLAETLRQIAVVKDTSVSDLVEEAIFKSLSNRGEAEQQALMVKLDAILRRLGAVEKAQETHFELSAHAARFTMSVTPEVPDADRAGLNARGATRFQNVMQAIITRLAGGKSVWRENFTDSAQRRAVGVPAE
jgi:hypothetical protein